MKKKNNKPFAQRILPWIIVAVVLYTVAAFALQFITHIEISPTLTTVYFTFWTVEIISIASIKSVKEIRKAKQDHIEGE